jgi:hypothetical protein
MNSLLPSELPYRWGIFLLVPPSRVNRERHWRLVASGRTFDRRSALRDLLAVCEARGLMPRDAVTRCEIAGPLDGRWMVQKRVNVTAQSEKDIREFGIWHMESF